MTTRHTISHADELYRGNAYKQGYSPDGRRGTLMSHIYVREYGAVAAASATGLVVCLVATGAYANMLTTVASGSLVTGINTATGDAVVFDVPRNVTLTTCGIETTIPLYVWGTDEWGNVMVETIVATAAGTVSGKKAFKTVTKLTTTKAFATTISVGSGQRLGLPFKAPNVGKILGMTIDGLATGGYTLVAAHATTAAGSSSQNDPDVRGTISPTTAPDGSKLFSVMMLVDSTTVNKAFGVAQATAVT